MPRKSTIPSLLLLLLLQGLPAEGRSSEAASPEAPAPPAQAHALPVYETEDLVLLDLDTVLERFQTAQETTRTLVADFRQRKVSSLLTEEETAEGRLYYSKPDKFAWAYAEPDDTLLLINGDTMLTWYRDLQKAQMVDIASKRKKVFQFLAIGEEVKKLKESFLITLRAPSPDDPPETVHLELVPKSRRIRDRLASLDMWLDARTYLPRRLHYEQADGDETSYLLHNLQPNTVIEDDRFSLDLPEGVKVDSTLSRPSQQ